MTADRSKLRLPTSWRGADGDGGRLATAWWCLRDHCADDHDCNREGRLALRLAGARWATYDAVLPSLALRPDGTSIMYRQLRQPWRAWAWLHRKLWAGAYTAKALLCVLLLPQRWPSYTQYPDAVVVSTGHGYMPDHEYSWGGSWHEVAIGRGWRPRTWWWHWAWESSV